MKNTINEKPFDYRKILGFTGELKVNNKTTKKVVKTNKKVKKDPNEKPFDYRKILGLTK